MAFVYRSSRDFDVKKETDGVGPGSYVGHKDYNATLSYAPFASMTERNTMQANDPTVATQGKGNPGPGFYKPNDGFDRINQDVENMKAIQSQGLDKFGISLIKPSGSFTSKVRRFNSSVSHNVKKNLEWSPEPGTYNLTKTWSAKGTIRMNASKKLTVVKENQNPPSIPSH